MTQRSPKATVERNRTLALASALVRGAVAAGLGLGVLTVLVMVLWISSPYPDSGPGAALRAAAGVWLLAHGTGLVRPDTLSGVPAPVSLVPLLLVVGPIWLAHRAARDAAEPEEGRPRPSQAGAFCAVTAGYLLVVAGAAAGARGGSLRPDPDTLVFPVALVVAGAAAAGVWTAAGRPLGPLPSWSPLVLQEAIARTLFRDRAEAVCRSAAVGVAVLLGGGALLVAVALGRNAGAAQEAFLGLAGDWSGRFAVLLLAASLVPNAALWGASYGLGPGFSLGTGATATPLGLDGTSAAPHFPLLAAVPDQGPGSLLSWAALAVPVAAALAVAWFTARRAAPADAPRAQAWSRRETVLVTLLAALACGAATGLLMAVAGGPLGTGALREFGPVWWLAGPAALAWTAGIGVPAVLLLRLWRLRTPGWAWRRGVPEAVETPVTAPAPTPTKATANATASDEKAGAEAQAAIGRPRRWWASWPGRGRTAVAAQDRSAASAVPAPGTGPETASGALLGGAGRGVERGDDARFEPYDFLPTDPWHEKDRHDKDRHDKDRHDKDRQEKDRHDKDWHEKDFREARWASLKRGSGGLMADFPAGPGGPAGEADPADSADAAGFAAGRPAPEADRPGPTP
ncbi:DUF6350 family protein [Streptomyces sp. NPDC026589]|uniref:cell division protein PerM n=1 Tax=Streptomyces sp. NPDC026589 TaxID=3155609 RepID=UPI0033CE1818